jgi:hypothetical protein
MRVGTSWPAALLLAAPPRAALQFTNTKFVPILDGWRKARTVS